jgi:hypothetical protein
MPTTRREANSITINADKTVTFIDDIIIKNNGTFGSISTPAALTIASTGILTTTSNLFVGGDLTVTGGDITLANGSTIDSSANAGILLLTEDVVKTSAALRVGNNIIQASDGGSTITMDINDNVTIGGNLTVTGGDITLANGSTIDSSANAGILLLTEDVVKTSAALRVGNNIIQASDGGSTITMDINDNVTIGGNLTVTGGDITLANGSTIDSSANAGILLLTEDVVKTSAAFTVGDNLTVTGGDITLANGSTIDSSANAGILLLTEDVVKTSAALRVGNNIIQASDGGSTITMDINDNVTIGGNLTVTGGDITLANGSTIDSSANAGILLLTEDVVKTSAALRVGNNIIQASDGGSTITMDINDNVTIGGNLTVTGGDITLANGSTIDSSANAGILLLTEDVVKTSAALRVGNNIIQASDGGSTITMDINDNVTIGGNLTVTGGDITLANGSTIDSSANAGILLLTEDVVKTSAAFTVGDNLTVTGGDITLANGSTIDSSANAGILLLTEDVVKTSAALRVGNNIIQASDGGSTITMDINDNVTIGGNLTVTGGDITLANGSTIDSSANAGILLLTEDVVKTSAAFTVGDNLTVTGGDITLANGSTIDSSANAGILLLTEDVVKTSAALRVGNNIIQASDGGSTITMDINDNVTIGGNLTVTGGDITLANGSTIDSSANAGILLLTEDVVKTSAAFTVGDNLTVTGGDITLANGSTIDSSANAGILLLTEDVVKTSAALRVGSNIIQASDGGSTITMDINDNVTIGGNLTVTGGDITLANGSTIDSSANAGILLLTEDVVKTSAALRVGSNIIQASDGGSTITMDINDNVTIGGNLTVTGGDITLANGSTIDSSANAGILLLTEDVVKTSAAFTVGDNLTVTGGDITLANSTIDSSANAGILLLTEDVVKTSAALRVGNNIIQASDGGSTITMDINDNVTTGDITLANGSTIDSSANAGILLLTEDVVKTSAALRVGNNIIQASDGGSTITMDINDNVTIGGNLTVTGGDITLANGSTIDSSANAGILLLTEDVVKTSAALRVGNNIIQASDGGSTITMDINDNVTIGGNLTVTGGDITLANGSTIDSSSNAGILLLTEDVVKTSAVFETVGNATIGGNLIVTGFIADTAGLELIKFSQTENAVNEVTITNAITGNSPSITVTGDDNDIDLTLGAKGTGTIKFTTNSSRGITFDFDGTAADKTTSIVANSTDNRTLTLPDVTGTLVSTGDTGSVSNNMLAGAITTAKLASDIGVTRTLTAYASASSNKVESGAIAIPAGSLLTKIIAVVTTQLNVTDTNNDTTIKVGNAANGDQIATAVNIQASGSSNVVIVGLGSSTDSTITTNLSGAASISLISGKAFIVNNTNIHITVENASNISTGAVSFVVEYIKLKTS